VIAKVLTAYSAGAGTVSSSDSILTAFQKVVGNIALKLTANSPITGATKTKVTYDANGLITSGSDATTADIADSTNKRYVTDANLTTIGNQSGVNTGDQTSVSGNAGTATILQTSRNIDGQAFNGSADITVIAPGTHAATGKTTPVDADELPLVDSAASNVLKKLTWANLKATLKTYLDTLYVAFGPFILSNVISPTSISSSQNNYNPTGLSTADVVRLTSSTTVGITGLVGGVAGRVITLQNVGTNIIFLPDQSGSSSAANRFHLKSQVTLYGDGGGITLIYDGTESMWREKTYVPQAFSGTPTNIAAASDAGVSPYYAAGDHAHGGSPTFAAGTYSPTLDNTTNVAASAVLGPFTYSRQDNIVTVAGAVSIDPTTTGNTVLGISLPIASNFADAFNASGVGTSVGSNALGNIASDATNDRVTLTFTAVDTASRNWRLVFMYPII